MSYADSDLKIDQDYERLIREARELRLQYVGGLLRSASNTVFGFFRFGSLVLTRRIIGKTHEIATRQL